MDTCFALVMEFCPSGVSGDDPGEFFADALSGKVEDVPADAADRSCVWEVNSGCVSDPGRPSIHAAMSTFLDGFIAGPNETPDNGLGDGGTVSTSG